MIEAPTTELTRNAVKRAHAERGEAFLALVSRIFHPRRASH